MLIKTITRGSSPGTTSGRFYAPVDVVIHGADKVGIIEQRQESGLSFWPEEALLLANALFEAAYKALDNREARTEENIRR